MEQKQRLALIDRAKGIGILMVVFSHLSSMTGFGNRLWSWYNPFMLTLFFMISGFMRESREYREALRTADSGGKTREASGEAGRGREPFPEFVRRRAHALLLPYFVFDALALGIRTVLFYWRGGVPEAAAQLRTGLFRIFTLRGLGPDWFLPVLFFADLLLELCLRCDGRSSAGGRRCCRSGLSPAAAVLFAASAASVFCLGGDRLSIIGPFRFAVVKSLAAAGFLVLGYTCAPAMRKLLGTARETQAVSSSSGRLPVRMLSAAAASLLGTLLIAGRYNLDFNQLDFGSRPLLLYADTLFGTCFVLCVSGIPDLTGRESAAGFLREFGRESLTILCTHLEWQIVPVIHFGWAAVAGMSPQEGKRFYAEMLIKLCLVMAVELGLLQALHRMMPWLYRKSLMEKRRPGWYHDAGPEQKRRKNTPGTESPEIKILKETDL